MFLHSHLASLTIPISLHSSMVAVFDAASWAEFGLWLDAVSAGAAGADCSLGAPGAVVWTHDGVADVYGMDDVDLDHFHRELTVEAAAGADDPPPPFYSAPLALFRLVALLTLFRRCVVFIFWRISLRVSTMTPNATSSFLTTRKSIACVIPSPFPSQTLPLLLRALCCRGSPRRSRIAIQNPFTYPVQTRSPTMKKTSSRFGSRRC